MNFSILAGALFGLCAAQLTTETTPTLNITAIAAKDGESILQCWQLKNKFEPPKVPGIVGGLTLFLGDMSNATYTILPPRYDGGFHTAPALQFVWFISGLIHLTLHNGKDEAWVQGGKYGLIAAADTSDVSHHGHSSTYPSDADTVALTFPLADGQKFEYSVLRDGPCKEEDMIGL